MICSDLLAEDFATFWSRRHGIEHGDLDTSWSGRESRNLFSWSILHLFNALRAQDESLELEVVEVERWPVALILHDPRRRHVAMDVQLLGDRLVRVRNAAGEVVASIAVGRPGHGFTSKLAAVIAGAANAMSATLKRTERG